MKAQDSSIHEFVFKGLLAEEALDKVGRRNRNLTGCFDENIAKSLSLDFLDENYLLEAKRMAAVYIAIAAFENSS